jgi:hypothetical protein
VIGSNGRLAGGRRADVVERHGDSVGAVGSVSVELRPRLGDFDGDGPRGVPVSYAFDRKPDWDVSVLIGPGLLIRRPVRWLGWLEFQQPFIARAYLERPGGTAERVVAVDLRHQVVWAPHHLV